MHTDPWTLQKGDLMGRVVRAQRKNRRVLVSGGISGLLMALAIRVVKKSELRVCGVLRPAYHKLAASGFFNACLPFIPGMRLLSFEKPQGTELQLLMGARPIARRTAGSQTWQISRPFRLFIDETSLPQ